MSLAALNYPSVSFKLINSKNEFASLMRGIHDQYDKVLVQRPTGVGFTTFSTSLFLSNILLTPDKRIRYISNKHREILAFIEEFDRAVEKQNAGHRVGGDIVAIAGKRRCCINSEVTERAEEMRDKTVFMSCKSCEFYPLAADLELDGGVRHIIESLNQSDFPAILSCDNIKERARELEICPYYFLLGFAHCFSTHVLYPAQYLVTDIQFSDPPNDDNFDLTIVDECDEIFRCIRNNSKEIKTSFDKAYEKVDVCVTILDYMESKLTKCNQDCEECITCTVLDVPRQNWNLIFDNMLNELINYNDVNNTVARARGFRFDDALFRANFTIWQEHFITIYSTLKESVRNRFLAANASMTKPTIDNKRFMIEYANNINRSLPSFTKQDFYWKKSLGNTKIARWLYSTFRKFVSLFYTRGPKFVKLHTDDLNIDIVRKNRKACKIDLCGLDLDKLDRAYGRIMSSRKLIMSSGSIDIDAFFRVYRLPISFINQLSIFEIIWHYPSNQNFFIVQNSARSWTKETIVKQKWMDFFIEKIKPLVTYYHKAVVFFPTIKIAEKYWRAFIDAGIPSHLDKTMKNGTQTRLVQENYEYEHKIFVSYYRSGNSRGVNLDEYKFAFLIGNGYMDWDSEFEAHPTVENLEELADISDDIKLIKGASAATNQSIIFSRYDVNDIEGLEKYYRDRHKAIIDNQMFKDLVVVEQKGTVLQTSTRISRNNRFPRYTFIFSNLLKSDFPEHFYYSLNRLSTKKDKTKANLSEFDEYLDRIYQAIYSLSSANLDNTIHKIFDGVHRTQQFVVLNYEELDQKNITIDDIRKSNIRYNRTTKRGNYAYKFFRR